MASGNPVVDAILARAGDRNTATAMLMGSQLESGWNETAVGDQGTSFGPFQIHLPAHPGVTAAQAEDPTFAANYMYGAYSAGVSQVPADMWSTDPAQAAATAAYYAERPAAMYPSGRVSSAWPQVQAAINGSDLGKITPGDLNQVASSITDPTGLLSAVTSIGNAFNSFGQSFQELPKVFDMLLKLEDPATWVRFMAAGVGVVFLFVGVFLLGREVIA